MNMAKGPYHDMISKLLGYLSSCYLASIENKGQHPSLQIFFKLMLRYGIILEIFENAKNGRKKQETVSIWTDFILQYL